MSATNLNDILSELAKGADALEAVPTLEARIRELEATLSHTISDLEHKADALNQANAKISEQSLTIGSLEVERDRYGFRAMELEDTMGKLAALVSPAVSEPEPVKVEATHEATPTSSVIDTTQTVELLDGGYDGPYNEPKPNPSNPTPTYGFPPKAPEVPSSTDFDNLTEACGIEPAAPALPYAGQAYWAKPQNVSWEDFVSGGGQKPHWMS